MREAMLKEFFAHEVLEVGIAGPAFAYALVRQAVNELRKQKPHAAVHFERRCLYLSKHSTITRRIGHSIKYHDPAETATTKEKTAKAIIGPL